VGILSPTQYGIPFDHFLAAAKLLQKIVSNQQKLFTKFHTAILGRPA
jgi:hypothetical protein